MPLLLDPGSKLTNCVFASENEGMPLVNRLLLVAVLSISAPVTVPAVAEPVAETGVTEPVAQPAAFNTSGPPSPQDSERNLWLYFGGNAGYTSVSPSSAIRESKRTGYAVHVKALLSKYWTDWVADLGLGYQHHRASGDDQFSPLVNPKVKVITRSGFVEFSPRYRLGRRWQLGPVFNGFFGTDVAFDESTTRDNKSFSLAGGLRADYETNFGAANRWRFGAQALRDLTVADRGIWWVMADVQFGFSLGGKTSAPAAVATSSALSAETLAVTAPASPKRPIAPRFAEVVMPEKSVKIYLGEAVLRFHTASFKLRPSSRQILQRVSHYLKQSPEAWKTMRVDGHADKRGKLDYNMRLSRERAERVKRELVTLGVPAEKISTEGYGPNRPIDATEDLEAYALNRRVELWIDGVVDPDALVRDLNELDSKESPTPAEN